ncbi:MAG: cell division protein FtsX, partial [Moorella sp. (in: Bacteria)]|nr:cell division protein FtsX [Moorella sp. (in: firmicutes)]
MTLNGVTYRIIGVLEPKGAGKAEGIDDKIIIPYTTAMKIAEKKKIEEIWAKAASTKEADLAVVQLGRIYKRKLGLDQKAPTPVPPGGGEGQPGEPIEKAIKSTSARKVSPVQPGGGGNNNPGLPISAEGLITITNLNQLVEEADKANRVMTLLLGGIAAVSLLVGGLGIMNI